MACRVGGVVGRGGGPRGDSGIASDLYRGLEFEHADLWVRVIVFPTDDEVCTGGVVFVKGKVRALVFELDAAGLPARFAGWQDDAALGVAIRKARTEGFDDEPQLRGHRAEEADDADLQRWRVRERAETQCCSMMHKAPLWSST